MTVVIPATFSLKNSTIKIGTNNFEATISGVAFVPTTAVSVWKGITPTAVYPTTGVTEWVANIDYAQDFATATSLSNYLLTNSGTTAVCDFYPIAGGVGYRATLLLVAGDIGTTGSDTATASVSLTVIGQPAVITP